MIDQDRAIGTDYNREAEGWPATGTSGGADFYGRITGSAGDGDNRWSYTFVEVAKTVAGYGGWTTLAGGRTGTARNFVEDMNAAAGVQGNGVDVANLDTADFTFTLQPCPAGVIVHVRTVFFIAAETAYLEYWFAYENGVDGSCDA